MGGFIKTIQDCRQITQLLNDIDTAATTAINKGLRFTIEWRDDGITEAQFKANHVWFRHCVKYLNANGHKRRSSVTGRPILLWDEDVFKKEVYKPMLKIWKGKMSTKDQSTQDPNELVMAISGHLATAYKVHIQLPEWPSAR